MTRRSRARFRPSADGTDNVREARWRRRDGIPRISLSARAQCKVADPASHQCRWRVFLLIDKAIRKKSRFRRVRPLLAIRARVVHFSPEEIHGNKICQLKIRNQEEPSGSMMARDDCKREFALDAFANEAQPGVRE